MPDIDDLLGEEAPRQHSLLSDKEVEEARAEAREKIMAAKRRAARANLVAEETARLQREEGLTTGDGTKDEIVVVTMDLPEFCANVMLNGTPYWHGQTYRVPRHVAETLRETMQNTWRHQDREIDGKDMTAAYRRKTNTVLSPMAA